MKLNDNCEDIKYTPADINSEIYAELAVISEEAAEEDDGAFVLHNGQVILDPVLADHMTAICIAKPAENHDDDTGYEWNEMGMSQLFSEVYYKEARYCPEHKSWYVYDNGVWTRDEGAIITAEKVKMFVRLMNLYVWEIKDEKLQSEYRKFVAKLGDRRYRERIILDARSDMLISPKAFDNNPYLINCLNGTYDLERHVFRKHRFDDYLTKQTNFNYRNFQQDFCKRWLQFIDEVTSGDKEKAYFLQRALGYSLLGASHEECMFILHGKTTRNGKSTLLNTIETMLGDYSSVVPAALICRGDRTKDAEAASPLLAGLKGVRFVTMAESNEYGKLDEEKIKQLTGGEEISARALYQSATKFQPQFTMWLSCNDLPTVTDKSLFASGRIKVIEFNRHFKASEQDKKLKQFFLEPENMIGIFYWLVLGYTHYTWYGLEMPETIQTVIDEYEKENDIVLQFLEIYCDRVTDYTIGRGVNATNNPCIKAKFLYQKFKMWCKSEGMYVISARRFNSEIQRHPEWFDRKTTSHGEPTYWGLKFKEMI